MKNKKIKNILINHFILNGNKQTCEKIIIKSFKKIQKNLSSKSHKPILKLAIINSTSAFRLFQLKQKKRKIKKQKQTKEIPIFISNNFKRIVWALKFIVQTTKSFSKNNKISELLKQELVNNAQNSENSLKIKNDLHKKTVTYKRLFLYFRW